jgi:hypothetical protein
MSAIDRIDDADENPSRERLRIRREIQLGLIAHAGKSVADVQYDKWQREKEAEAALAAKRNRLDTRPAQSGDGMTWSEFSDEQEQTLIEVVAALKMETRKLIAEAVGPLKAENKTLRGRWSRSSRRRSGGSKLPKRGRRSSKRS